MTSRERITSWWAQFWRDPAYATFREWYYAVEKWDGGHEGNVSLENHIIRALYQKTMGLLQERENLLASIRELAEPTDRLEEAQARLLAIRASTRGSR